MTALEVPVPALELAPAPCGLDRNQALQRLKDFLQREKAQTFQLHQQGASGRLVVTRLARLVDTAINFAHTYALENTPPPVPLASVGPPRDRRWGGTHPSLPSPPPRPRLTPLDGPPPPASALRGARWESARLSKETGLRPPRPYQPVAIQ